MGMKKILVILAAFIADLMGMAMSFAPQTAETAMVMN
jgi:hypothetical protein